MTTSKFLYAILFSFTTLLVNPEPLTAMSLKYQKEIDKFSPTASDWEKFDKINDKPSFRWVFKDLTDFRNFHPVYKFGSRLEEEIALGRAGFKGWALSFFDTKDNAQKKFDRFYKKNTNFHKAVGDCIAEGVVYSEDGLSEIKCNSEGHFNHFEFVDTDFYKDRFTIVGSLIGQL